MSAAVEILRMRPEHLEEASALIVNVIQGLDIYSEAARAEETRKYSHDKLAQLLTGNPHSVELAFVGGKMAGFLATEFQSGPIWIHWYGVHASGRGIGLGEAMLAHLIARASNRAATRIWCDTRTNNIQSIGLLEKLNFRRLCELKNHWHNQDYFLWSRDLL